MKTKIKRIEKPVPPEIQEAMKEGKAPKQHDGDRNLQQNRRTQALTRIFKYNNKTCDVWDIVEVIINTDKAFMVWYPSHYNRAVAIFLEARRMYWESACILRNYKGNTLETFWLFW